MATKKKEGNEKQYLSGKNIALIFEKSSTRTRCAFEAAAFDQGANVTYLGPSGSQIGTKESMKDTARVLGRMYDGIEYRGFGQELVEILAQYAGVPVWNGLTDAWHPTQILADVLTVREEFGRLEGIAGETMKHRQEILYVAFYGSGREQIFASATDSRFISRLTNLAAGLRQEIAGSETEWHESVIRGRSFGKNVPVTEFWARISSSEIGELEMLADSTAEAGRPRTGVPAKRA